MTKTKLLLAFKILIVSNFISIRTTKYIKWAGMKQMSIEMKQILQKIAIFAMYINLIL